MDAETQAAIKLSNEILCGVGHEVNGISYTPAVDGAANTADIAEYIETLEPDPIQNNDTGSQLGEVEYLESSFVVDDNENEVEDATVIAVETAQEDINYDNTNQTNETKEDEHTKPEEVIASTEAADAAQQSDEEDKDKTDAATLQDEVNNDETASNEELNTEQLIVQEDEQEQEENKEEEEYITGDNDSGIAQRVATKKEETVDENQCRVCTATDDLVSLFTKIDKATPHAADMLMSICPNVSIVTKDYMPQYICNSCLSNVKIALNLKAQLETTERELRKKLSRSKNKIRRPRGYVVIDAPDSEPPSEEEPNDDVEFKVSEVEDTSPDSDSDDSNVSGKKRRTSRGAGSQRGRRKANNSGSGGTHSAKTLKREYFSDNEENDSPQRKRTTSPTYFTCSDCGQSFTRKQSLTQHRKVHETIAELTCEVCDKQFKMRRAYYTHRSKHEECTKCDRLFKNRTELQRHIRQSHQNVDDVMYECNKCRRKFSTDVRLKRHKNDCGTKRNEYETIVGKNLFKSVAPPTTTYWSDSFSD